MPRHCRKQALERYLDWPVETEEVAMGALGHLGGILYIGDMEEYCVILLRNYEISLGLKESGYF